MLIVDAGTSLIMESLFIKSDKSPWGGILRVQCVVVEELAIFTPLQRGVTLLLLRLPVEESGAVQCHRGSHIPRESGRTPRGFERWGSGALGLCEKDTLLLSVWATDNGGLHVHCQVQLAPWRACWNKMPPCRCSISPFTPPPPPPLTKYTAGTSNSSVWEPHH